MNPESSQILPADHLVINYKDLETKNNEIAKKNSELENLRNHANAVSQSSAVEVSLLRDKIANLETQLEDNKQKIFLYDASGYGIRSRVQSIVNLTTAEEIITRKVETDFKNHVDSLKSEVEDKVTRIKDLKTEIKTMTNDHVNSLNVIKKEYNLLTKELELDSEAEKLRLREVLDKKVKTFEDKITSLNNTIILLNKEIELMKTNSTIDDQINHYKTHISELTTELEALQFSKTVRLNWFERFALNLIIKISPQFKKSLPSWYVKDVTVNNLEYATARKNRLEVELGK